MFYIKVFNFHILMDLHVLNMTTNFGKCLSVHLCTIEISLCISRSNTQNLIKLQIQLGLEIISYQLVLGVYRSTDVLLLCSIFHDFHENYISRTNVKNLIKLYILLNLDIDFDSVLTLITQQGHCYSMTCKRSLIRSTIN